MTPFHVFLQAYDKSNKNNKIMVGTKKFPRYGVGYIYSDKLDLDNPCLFSPKTEWRDGGESRVSGGTEIDILFFHLKGKVNIYITNNNEHYLETNVKIQYALIRENVHQDDMVGNEYKLTLT